MDDGVRLGVICGPLHREGTRRRTARNPPKTFKPEEARLRDCLAFEPLAVRGYVAISQPDSRLSMSLSRCSTVCFLVGGFRGRDAPV